MIRYVEPKDYIPEEIRKKYKIGEYAQTEDENQSNDENTEEASE